MADALQEIVAFCVSTWPHDRIPVPSLDRLIGEFGADTVESAAVGMATSSAKWSLPTLQAACVSLGRQGRADAKRSQDDEAARVWQRHVAEVERERRDPGVRARTEQMRAIHADFRAGRIDNREMLRRIAAVIVSGPRIDRWRQEQADSLLLTADELRGAYYGGMAAVAQAEDEDVPFE